MAISAVKLTYIGQPSFSYTGPAGSPVQGQIMAGSDVGPLARTLVGTSVVTLDGSSTSFTLNFIDGVQKLGQYVITLPLTSVTAPATINGVANQAIYSGVGSMGQIKVGDSVTFAGFSNGGNNGTFTVNAVSTTGLTVTNSSSVAETNYAATVQDTLGPKVAAVDISRSGTTDTASAGVGVVGAHGITNVGCTVDLSGAGTNNQTMGLLAVIYFNS